MTVPRLDAARTVAKMGVEECHKCRDAEGIEDALEEEGYDWSLSIIVSCKFLFLVKFD
jgi:hypothetical protein